MKKSQEIEITWQILNQIWQHQNYQDLSTMAKVENNKNLLDSYNYKPDRPFFSSDKFQVHHAQQKETKLAVTIKIVRGYSQDLLKYLKKLKDCKSQNTIRIYEIYQEKAFLAIVTEHVGYGSLANALAKCQRLEQSDAIALTKMLLNGYIDLLRLDSTWVGNQKDVQFTQSGAKLSWNNFTNLKDENSITKIIQKISIRNQNKNSILPFPRNKIIQQLISVSKESASQISLSPHMKKKQKGIRKKSKNWSALKQLSSKNQYIDEAVYLGVDSEYGFVRVKIYDKGTLIPQVLNLNKTKSNFTKVLDAYQENGKTIVISEYSNDGSLQNYVGKLKGSGVKLTEEHIEFFFFSLFEPLKQIQQSSIKSIGMLHIRNIYIENGVPKIGEPVPMGEKLLVALREREDVPDFYHSLFKRQPNSKSDTYDTYSLGVLLYKLMYTQYPIFPGGKVHIPTAPTYSKRLKTSLEILLNEGGNLKSLQAKIEVSDTVKNQVKQNKALLEVMSLKSVQKSSVELTRRTLIAQEESERHAQQKSEEKVSQEANDEDEHNCCSLCCYALEFTNLEEAQNRYVSVTSLEESPYRIYRICTKIIIILLFYSLVFYYFFLQSNFNFLGKQSSLKVFNVTIATIKYPIVTADSQAFQTQFNKTSRDLGALQGLNCLIDGYNDHPIYSNKLVADPSGWIFFVVASLLVYILIMAIKGWLNYNFDTVRVVYNWDHGRSNFNISNLIVFNLLLSCLINGHYYFFNFIFSGQLQPCVGSQYYYSSSYTFFNDNSKFLFPYMTTFILQIVIVLVHMVMIGRAQSVKYNKLVNPIIVFCPFLITQWINLRIGVLDDYFVPNGLQSNEVLKNYFLNIKYIDILGTAPEILWLAELLLSVFCDSIYWCFLDKRRRLLIQDTSAASLEEMIK